MIPFRYIFWYATKLISFTCARCFGNIHTHTSINQRITRRIKKPGMNTKSQCILVVYLIINCHPVELTHYWSKYSVFTTPNKDVKNAVLSKGSAHFSPWALHEEQLSIHSVVKGAKAMYRATCYWLIQLLSWDFAASHVGEAWSVHRPWQCCRDKLPVA